MIAILALVHGYNTPAVRYYTPSSQFYQEPGHNGRVRGSYSFLAPKGQRVRVHYSTGGSHSYIIPPPHNGAKYGFKLPTVPQPILRPQFLTPVLPQYSRQPQAFPVQPGFEIFTSPYYPKVIQPPEEVQQPQYPAMMPQQSQINSIASQPPTAESLFTPASDTVPAESTKQYQAYTDFLRQAAIEDATSTEVTSSLANDLTGLTSTEPQAESFVSFSMFG